MRFDGDKGKADAVYKGVDPLTPEDIAEVVVFTAGRKENVVIADTLIFPNHQVSLLNLKLCHNFHADFRNLGSCNSDAPKIVILNQDSCIMDKDVSMKLHQDSNASHECRI